MAGIDARGAQLGRPLRREPAGAHEAQALGDMLGKLLIAMPGGAVLDEAEIPPMHVIEIGVAALREGAQQIERRRRLPVGHQHPLRVGRARFLGELDAVDDVAAIARQLLAVLHSRSAPSAAWRTVRRCGRASPPASRRHRSAPRPFAATRGRNRGWRRRDARRSFRRNRRPAAGRPRRRRRGRASPSARAPRRRKRAAERWRAAARLRRACRGPDRPEPARSA